MYIIVLITCPNKKEAERIAKALVENKLAACVNIIADIKSIFWWQGNIDQVKEVLLVVKSKKSNSARIIKLVKSLHSYQVPEIIALPISDGNKEYLDWIDESCG